MTIENSISKVVKIHEKNGYFKLELLLNTLKLSVVTLFWKLIQINKVKVDLFKKIS